MESESTTLHQTSVLPNINDRQKDRPTDMNTYTLASSLKKWTSSPYEKLQTYRPTTLLDQYEPFLTQCNLNLD